MIYKKNKTKELRFPLGGIGAGSVSLSGEGSLVDWELFNRPDKWTVNGSTHFAVKAEAEGEYLGMRVLQGDTLKDFPGTPAIPGNNSWNYGNGLLRGTMAGFPHFNDVTFDAAYPIAELTFKGDLPGVLTLEAYNPFIPSDDRNSSLPCAFFKWTAKNNTDKEIVYTFAFSCCNIFGEQSVNTFTQSGKRSSIVMTSKKYGEKSSRYGDMCISTDAEDVSYQENWFRGAWFDDLTVYLNDFNKPGKLQNRSYDTPGNSDMCTLCASVKVKPGEEKSINYLLTWFVPNVHKYWSWSPLTPEEEEEKKAGGEVPMWKTYYASLFSSAEEVADYCFANRERLYSETSAFKNALMSSTLPPAVTDALQGNIALLKSTTCMRLENGDFWAFEGVKRDVGSCEGTCAHVWNYAYAMPFLFPALERTIRAQDYTYNVTPTGEMRFRQMLPQGSFQSSFRACVDGQFGGVMKFYRDWKICGDDAFLKKYWPEVKKSIEYAWSKDNYDRWDPEKSGVITGRQHHTLDVELFGANSWLTGFYLGALKAGAEMAEYLGEAETAKEYREIFARGSATVEKELFNGNHYIQSIDLTDKEKLLSYEGAEWYWNDETKEIKYQIKDGCIIDQTLAQWHSRLIGLGDIFDSEHCRKALETLYRVNFKSMRNSFNPCRVFACDDEKGLVICDWDKNEYRPKIPIPYTEETMCGFEYAAGCQMLMYGMEKEALDVCAAIRDRYDGEKRNPWGEIECGGTYARSMASWSYLLTYSGFEYDMTKRFIGFNPIHSNFSGFWSVDGAWGNISCATDKVTLTVLYGEVTLDSFGLPEGFCQKKYPQTGRKALLKGKSLKAGDSLVFTSDEG